MNKPVDGCNNAFPFIIVIMNKNIPPELIGVEEFQICLGWFVEASTGLQGQTVFSSNPWVVSGNIPFEDEFYPYYQIYPGYLRKTASAKLSGV